MYIKHKRKHVIQSAKIETGWKDILSALNMEHTTNKLVHNYYSLNHVQHNIQSVYI